MTGRGEGPAQVPGAGAGAEVSKMEFPPGWIFGLLRGWLSLPHICRVGSSQG